MSRRSQSRRPWAKPLGAAALSVLCHAAVATAAFLTWSSPPAARAPPAIDVALIALPSPPPLARPAPTTAASIGAPAATPRRAFARPALAPAGLPPPPAAPIAAPPGPASDGLTDADLAGAATAGSGAGGGCDMARRVQDALRRDPLVRAALSGADLAGGRAIRVWDGDWVRSGGEDGKGLAAVREAITWEVAFAPAPCRAQPVRGLVLLSPDERPGSAQLALGAGAWRWADLLGVR
jgi:hypothetical protein